MTPKSEIKTIFWDIGGVLPTNGWDKGQRARILGRLGVAIADYKSRHEEANYYWQCGLSTAEYFFNQMVLIEPRSIPFKQLWAHVCAESEILHPDCFDILGTLAVERRFILATLNDESRELDPQRLDAFRPRPYLNFFICSGDVHEMKPNSANYRSAVDILGFQAERALFIGDKIDNCKAAAGHGMQAIRFESPAQLRGGLAQLGIQAA